MEEPTVWDHLLEEPPSLRHRLVKQWVKLKSEAFVPLKKVRKHLDAYKVPYILLAVVVGVPTTLILYLVTARAERLAEEEARLQMLWDEEPPKAEKEWDEWREKFLGEKADEKYTFDCVGWHNFGWAKLDEDNEPSYTLKCLIAKKGELPHQRVACNQWGCQLIPVASEDD